MSYEERPAKRVRVDNSGNRESEIRVDKGFYSPPVENSNALGTVGQEVYECCYGMVNKN